MLWTDFFFKSSVGRRRTAGRTLCEGLAVCYVGIGSARPSKRALSHHHAGIQEREMLEKEVLEMSGYHARAGHGELVGSAGPWKVHYGYSIDNKVSMHQMHPQPAAVRGIKVYVEPRPSQAAVALPVSSLCSRGDAKHPFHPSTTTPQPNPNPPNTSSDNPDKLPSYPLRRSRTPTTPSLLSSHIRQHLFIADSDPFRPSRHGLRDDGKSTGRCRRRRCRRPR